MNNRPDDDDIEELEDVEMDELRASSSSSAVSQTPSPADHVGTDMRRSLSRLPSAGRSLSSSASRGRGGELWLVSAETLM